MKKGLIFITLSIIIQSAVLSQSCLPDGIEFSTQAEINSFQINYPNCTEIEGDVIINGPTEITDLLGLSVVETIGGNLYISLNLNLNSLSGLDNLSYVGGELQIWNNPCLDNLDNLSNLQHVGALVVASNDSLDNITGISTLDSIVSYLHIEDNEMLTSISGLENITSIAGSLTIGSYWGGNTSLTNLTGLNNLISIGGDLLIAGNHSLTNFGGLNNLISIGGKLWINNNDSLINLNGLNNLSSMGALLWITSNYSLSNLAALDSIIPGSIIDLWISNNSYLHSCEVQCICSYLANPSGVVSIYNNSAGCNNPTEIASACGVTLTCLPYGHYYFFRQSEVDNFQTNYPNCSDLNGDVHILGDDITNLTGLGTISSVGNMLSIGSFFSNGNPFLTNLSGLENLDSIGGLLNIFNNDSLNDISALSNLTIVDGELRIDDNPYLTSLTGLDNVDGSLIYSISFNGNSSLRTCEVQSVCDFLALPNSNVYIENNASGCNNVEEVEYACTVWVLETTPHSTFTIYPNPTENELFFSTKDGITIREVMIYDQLGQKVLHRKLKNNKVDISSLEQGLYIIELVTDRIKSRQKLIIR